MCIELNIVGSIFTLCPVCVPHLVHKKPRVGLGLFVCHEGAFELEANLMPGSVVLQSQ